VPESEEVKRFRQGNDAPAQPPREPLVVLRKWPNACRADEDCTISEYRYPAPSHLGKDDVEWWLDFTEIRVNASRNIVNNSVAAVFGALVASLATGVSAWTSGPPWVTALTGVVTVLAILLAGQLLLGDSDHAPLEQRLLLYKQQARDLARRDVVQIMSDMSEGA
jgi:hypothetical protein